MRAGDWQLLCDVPSFLTYAARFTFVPEIWLDGTRDIRRLTQAERLDRDT